MINRGLGWLVGSVSEAPGVKRGHECYRNLSCQQFNSPQQELRLFEQCEPVMALPGVSTSGITTIGPYAECKKVCRELCEQKCSR